MATYGLTLQVLDPTSYYNPMTLAISANGTFGYPISSVDVGAPGDDSDDSTSPSATSFGNYTGYLHDTISDSSRLIPVFALLAEISLMGLFCG